MVGKTFLEVFGFEETDVKTFLDKAIVDAKLREVADYHHEAVLAVAKIEKKYEGGVRWPIDEMTRDREELLRLFKQRDEASADFATALDVARGNGYCMEGKLKISCFYPGRED